MKTKLLLIPILLIAGMAWGQQKEITIDPFGKDTFETKIKKGSSVKFKINNVNTFRINGITESKPLNIDFEVPEIFKNFIAPKAKEGTDEDKTKKDSAIGWSDSKINKPQNILDQYQKQAEENFIINFSSFINKYHNLHQQIALEEKITNQIKDSIFIENTLVLQNNVKEYFKAVYDNKSTEEAKKETGATLNNLMIEYSKMEKIYDELNKTLDKDSVIISGELKSEDKKTTVKVEKATVIQDRKKYFSEEMAFAKKTFETISDIKNRNEFIKKAQSGIDLYNKIDKASFIAYTDAEQINADEVTITPKLKFSNGKIAHEFKPLTIKSYGGVKVNFSSGYLISFVGDDNYSTYKDGSGNNIGVNQSNKNELTHGLGGLAHVYYNGKSSLQLGVSAGASLATNGNLGFYFGGSAFFLDKNRLVLTTGYSFIKLKKLNTANLNKIDDNKYEFISTNDIEIRYDDVYKGAWFIGVTYNLAK